VEVPSAPAETRVRLPELQGALLDRVAPLVRPGGVLVYAVCTLNAEEGPEAIAAFRARHPGFVPVEGDASLPARLRSAAVVLRPDVDGTDGFMVHRLRREN
jgi:16S rRNA (cytosine967-C5)-methyltransferase